MGENKEFVVLLHGLSRTSRSMRPIKKALEKNGYSTFNVNYPSRKKPIEELSEFVLEKINQNFADHPKNSLHFVTHSMGGIILRQIIERTKVEGMNDFPEVPNSHSFMMGNQSIQKETINFLKNGHFSKKKE